MTGFEEIKNNTDIRQYIRSADASMLALGYTEHSFGHVGICVDRAAYIMSSLGYSERMIELTRIAAYMHDIGNLVNRADHSQSGAVMAFTLLQNYDFTAEEIALIVTAIGNHDEGTGVPVNALAAALIIADKSDVRKTRVRDKDTIEHDIHDRVNYAVEKTELEVDTAMKRIVLKLSLNTDICPIIDYFEIFLVRMKLCKMAAEALSLSFELVINGQKFV